MPSIREWLGFDDEPEKEPSEEEQEETEEEKPIEAEE